MRVARYRNFGAREGFVYICLGVRETDEPQPAFNRAHASIEKATESLERVYEQYIRPGILVRAA